MKSIELYLILKLFHPYLYPIIGNKSFSFSMTDYRLIFAPSKAVSQGITPST